MKGLFPAFVAFASLALAQNSQNFDGEPSCAVACLKSAISIAGCGLYDEGCKCGPGLDAIGSAVSPCLLTACNPGEIFTAASHGLALCSSYSASIAAANATTTAAGVSTSSSLSASKTRAVAAGTTSVPESTSSSATTSKASTTAVVTNGAPAVIAGFGGVVGLVAGLMVAL